MCVFLIFYVSSHSSTDMGGTDLNLKQRTCVGACALGVSRVSKLPLHTHITSL